MYIYIYTCTFVYTKLHINTLVLLGRGFVLQLESQPHGNCIPTGFAPSPTCSSSSATGLCVRICTCVIVFAGALQEFWLAVILTAWTASVQLEHPSPPEILEFFAGRCKIARWARQIGRNSIAVDLLYDVAMPASKRNRVDKRSPFDLNSDAGLASLCLHTLELTWSPEEVNGTACCISGCASPWCYVASGRNYSAFLPPAVRRLYRSMPRLGGIFSPQKEKNI